VERNGGNLECQAGQNEDQTEDQAQFALSAGDGLRDFGKANMTGGGRKDLPLDGGKRLLLRHAPLRS